MLIGYMVPFGSNPMAELETRIRFRYCVEKLGHELIEIDMNGCDIATGLHAENLNIDFIFSHDTAVCAENPLPDFFSLFAHWSPNGFLVPEDFSRYFVWMSKYDVVVGGYESNKIRADVGNHPDVYSNYYNITSSISCDFALKPVKSNDLKLFYVGINLEKIQRGNTRYIKLLKYLDENDRILIYGPNRTLNVENLWEGFKNYKGEIPFDGYSIIKKINEAGIALALNSPVHSANGTVSNRIYEAAAAGAVIISDENEYVRKYFGDSVFYIDITKDEDEQIEDIKTILNYIKSHPQKAYNMAKTAQGIFLRDLSMDRQIEGLFQFVQDEKTRYINSCCDVVDIICFVSEYVEYRKILDELSHQFYQFYNMIVVTTKSCIETIKNDSTSKDNRLRLIENTFSTYGEALCEIEKFLVGSYFMFVDKNTSLQHNHILKLVRALNKCDKYFAYTGTYLKYLGDKGETIKYVPLSTVPLTKEEICAFLRLSCTDINILYNIEERFSFSCCMFKRSIMELTNKSEMSQIKKAIHFYLACASIIKKNMQGHFVYSISCGYKLDGEKNVQDIFMEDRKFNYLYHKTENTYFKDLYLVYFKYDYDVNPVPWGINYSQLYGQKISRKRLVIRSIKKYVPKPIKEFVKKIIFA